MAAVPARSHPPSRVRRRLGAVVAAAAYCTAAVVAYQLVQSALDDGAPVAGGVGAEAAAPAGAASAGAADGLARRTQAARAQRSVFRIEAANGAAGSAFAAWREDGRTYLVTAGAVVARALADGERRVFLRRGDRVWDGRVWAVHRDSGLAVVRVEGPLGAPLWQQPRRAERLAPQTPATVVPAGPDAPLAEGTVVSVAGKRAVVAAPRDELSLGAPVLAATGRITGVVVAGASGGHRVVAIERACARVRSCA
jgi:hypothetical protein